MEHSADGGTPRASRAPYAGISRIRFWGSLSIPSVVQFALRDAPGDGGEDRGRNRARLLSVPAGCRCLPNEITGMFGPAHPAPRRSTSPMPLDPGIDDPEVHDMKNPEHTYDEIFDQATIDEALEGLGTCNVLIAGRTGVGKSTLINSVFHGKMATTGDGRPVTKNARLICKEGVPLCVWDTRGLEMADFRETLDELTQLVERRARDPDAERHIHVAWLCILEDGRRVEDAERDLCRTLSRRMPVLGVITKARSDEGFGEEAQRLLPEAANIVRVRAIAEELDDGHTLEPMGLDDLIKATVGLLPEGIQTGVRGGATRLVASEEGARAPLCMVLVSQGRRCGCDSHPRCRCSGARADPGPHAGADLGAIRT